MLISTQNFAANLLKVRERIERATRSAGRGPAEVTLIGVTKGHETGAVGLARDAGIVDIGENYLQEALVKMSQVADPGLHWHFIGRLQANKTREIATHFEWVHGVDRLKIAVRLADQRPYHAPPLNLCIQVELVPEASKQGIAPAEVPALAEAIECLPHVHLRGLMCLPPAKASEPVQRERFARLRGLRDRLNATGHRLDTLSMGMSEDFEPAIREGATHIRLGTILFGPRGLEA
jgi:PLP dependent protein